MRSCQAASTKAWAHPEGFLRMQSQPLLPLRLSVTQGSSPAEEGGVSSGRGILQGVKVERGDCGRGAGGKGGSTPSGCRSPPFLKWDLARHPRSHLVLVLLCASLLRTSEEAG